MDPRSSIAHVVPALFGRSGIVGGAERYVFELARHMAAAVPTRLVTFGEEDRTEKHGALEVRVIGHPRHIRGQRTNPFSWRLLRELRPARIVHCHQQHVVASSVAAAWCRLTGRKVFVSDLGGGGWDISGYVSTDRWFHGHLHISQYSRRIFGQEHFARAHVIMGGVDTVRFSPDPSTPPAPTVVFVGRLMPHKGVNDLVEALPEGLTLELIGQEGHERFLKDLTRLAEGRRVVFRRTCGDDELVEAYRRALCVVLPSVYRDLYGGESSVPELLGQTLLEGMACGIPAICTDVASMPEVVSHGVTGFVVPPNNPAALQEKLVWLRDHPERASEMGRAGRRRVEALFTWPAVVDRCLRIYGAAGAVGRGVRTARADRTQDPRPTSPGIRQVRVTCP